MFTKTTQAESIPYPRECTDSRAECAGRDEGASLSGFDLEQREKVARSRNETIRQGKSNKFHL
jgi:hypothetical protein